MKKFQIMNWIFSFFFLLMYFMVKQGGYHLMMIIREDTIHWIVFVPLFTVLFIISFLTAFFKMIKTKKYIYFSTIIIAALYWYFSMIMIDRFYMTYSDSLQWLLISIGLILNLIPIGCTIYGYIKQ